MYENKNGISLSGIEEVGSSVPLSLEQSQFDSGYARHFRRLAHSR